MVVFYEIIQVIKIVIKDHDKLLENFILERKDGIGSVYVKKNNIVV